MSTSKCGYVLMSMWGEDFGNLLDKHNYMVGIDDNDVLMFSDPDEANEYRINVLDEPEEFIVVKLIITYKLSGLKE